MLEFIATTYGATALNEAWEEFLLFPKDPVAFDFKSPQAQLFLPWFFHCWTPDPHGTEVEDPALHDRAPTRVLLERSAARLEPALRRYLERCVESPVSFHEIIAVQSGHGFRARDVLRDEEYEVQERSASATLRVGDLLFAQIVTVGGLTLLEAAPPVSLPPIEKIAVIELRRKIRRNHPLIDAETLFEWNIELRELYLEAVERILSPKLPQLHNTDGDPLEPQRLIFDLDDGPDAVTAAFEGLRHLATEQASAVALDRAERDPVTGAPLLLSFCWVKRPAGGGRPEQNTILGQIEIRRGRLSCEVNSAKRAATFRRHVKKALPKIARFRLAEIESIEHAFANRSSIKPPSAPPASPEVQAYLARYMSDYYERWLDEKIPALGGRTPRAAVRDADGREQVEALLRDFERSGSRSTPPLDPSIIPRLRQHLGLAPPAESV